jgi:hypothetical protein
LRLQPEPAYRAGTSLQPAPEVTVPRTSSRLSLTVGLTALALALTPLSPVAAHPRPDRIALETGSLPEGIAAGPGRTFFVGARSDGDIYVGNVRKATVTRLVDETTPGAAAVGMYYDDRSGLLWVAGGGPRAGRGLGTVTAYDGADEVFSTTVAGAGFLNDVVVTRDAVYVTDSFSPALVVVPLDRSGRPTGRVGSLPLAGEYKQPAGFGANGIRELPGGDLVVVAAGTLYRVDPATGVADAIEVRGPRDLSGGDGLEVRGKTLYVVNGYGGDEVVVLRLAGDNRSARTTRVLTESSPEQLDRPTTAALVAGSLYVVNGRFSIAGPTTENFVTRLPRR